MPGWQIARGGLGAVGAVLLAQAVALSFDGQPEGVWTYVVLYGGAALFGVIVAGLGVKRRQPAALSHVQVALDALLREGIALTDEVHDFEPDLEQAPGGYTMTVGFNAVHMEQVRKFRERARGLLITSAPSLLLIYADGEREFLRRVDAERNERRSRLASGDHVGRMHEAAATMKGRPTVVLGACLAGITAALRARPLSARSREFVE